MEPFPGDEEGSTDDLTGGKRKSKLKTLKICLFGRTKRETKFSQSASDVTEAKGLGSTDNLCSGMLGSRALSHDSIFLVDQDLPSPEHPRVLSQENVHGRIKELQMKLLQQNLHLGPPPLVLPIKHPEDLGGSSEDDGLPHTPPEISIGNNRAPRGVSYKASSQLSSHPRSPVPKAPLTCSVPPTSSVPHSAFSPALDFSTPAQFTPCLDNSAARHRMSIKPRNQRASAKNKRLNMTESRPRSESLNNFDRPLTEEGPAIPGGRTRLRCQSTLILKPQQGVSNTPIAPPKTSTPTFPCKPSPQEQPHPGVPVVSPAPKTRTLPGAKQPQPSSVTTVQYLKYTPQQQTLKQSLGDPKPPDPSQTKRDVLSKLTPSNASRRRQEQQGARREGDKPNEEELTAIDMGGNVSEGEEVEEESGEGVEDAVEAKEETQEEGKRAFSGNLHSISLSLRVLAEADTSQTDLKIKHHSAEVGALPLSPYTPSSKHTGLEGLRDTPPTRANSMPKKLYTNNWDAPTTLSSSRGRAGSLREADTATSAQSTPSPLTKEAQTTPATPKEDQTIPVLPIEAQATSLAPQDTPTAPQAAPQAAVSWMSMAWGKTRGLQQLFTSSLPREFIGMQSPTQPQAQTTTQPQTPSLAKIVTQTQRQNTTQPQTQTTTPPQAQTTTQPQSQTTMQPLTAKLLQSQNAAQPPQTAAQAPTQITKLPVTQTTKHLQTTKTPQTQNATQPRTTTQPSTHNSKPSTQTSNQINTREEQPTTTQPLAQSTLRSVSQVTSQSSRRANQPTLCPTPQTQSQASLRIAPMGATSTQPPAPSTLSSSPRSTPSQPPWSAQGLNPIPQPKPASAPTTTPVQPLVRGERTPCDQGKSEGAAVSTERRVDRDRPGSVEGTAAFMEKRAEWTPPAGSKVEFRRTRTPPESQPTAELAAPPKATHTHRDTKDANLDRRPESRPTIVTGRLADREDKWLRKNMPTSSSPSSSLLQAISDSGDQPSWMELAKRKSMAWNDNTMD